MGKQDTTIGAPPFDDDLFFGFSEELATFSTLWLLLSSETLEDEDRGLKQPNIAEKRAISWLEMVVELISAVKDEKTRSELMGTFRVIGDE